MVNLFRLGIVIGLFAWTLAAFDVSRSLHEFLNDTLYDFSQTIGR